MSRPAQFTERMNSHNMSFLSDLTPGETAYIEKSRAADRRLTELGIVSGTHVECVAKAPFGDAKAYLIRGAVIALRRSDALEIEVSRTKRTFAARAPIGAKERSWG